MNILPTDHEYALRCLTIYIGRIKKEGEDFPSLIKKAAEGKDRPDHGIVVNLSENVTMKVSMNTRDTIFVKFRQLNYKNEAIEIAEFFYDKAENFVIKSNSIAKNSDANILTVKQLFVSVLNK
jgi:hypothetical protein